MLKISLVKRLKLFEAGRFHSLDTMKHNCQVSDKRIQKTSRPQQYWNGEVKRVDTSGGVCGTMCWIINAHTGRGLEV